MGSVLSAANAALCSFVSALFDMAEMMQLRAANPQLSAEELEDLHRWFRDQAAEQDALDAARRLRPRNREMPRMPRHCHFKLKHQHPCDRIGSDKNKLTENNACLIKDE